MKKDQIRELIETMKRLRGDDGCPWDKEQDHRTLREYLLEEVYEVLECIDSNDPDSLKEELGDLLLQVIFHAQIAAENSHFSIDDVADSINTKLIRRHPNVFGDKKIKTAEEQSRSWEEIKSQEGNPSTVAGIPKQLPALLRAQRTQQRAADVGFDWRSIEDVWPKLYEEVEELKSAIISGRQLDIEEEMGDVLFTMVNLSRFLKVNSENALRQTIEKFVMRLQLVEERVKAGGRNMEDCTLEEMDALWDEIKSVNSNQ